MNTAKAKKNFRHPGSLSSISLHAWRGRRQDRQSGSLLPGVQQPQIHGNDGKRPDQRRKCTSLSSTPTYLERSFHLERGFHATSGVDSNRTRDGRKTAPQSVSRRESAARSVLFWRTSVSGRQLASEHLFRVTQSRESAEGFAQQGGAADGPRRVCASFEFSEWPTADLFVGSPSDLPCRRLAEMLLRRQQSLLRLPSSVKAASLPPTIT